MGRFGILGIIRLGGEYEYYKSIREKLEDREYSILSEFATKSKESKKRRIPEEECEI